MIKAIIFDFFGVICQDPYWAWLKQNIPNLENKRAYFQELSNKVDLGKMTMREESKVLSRESGVKETEVSQGINSEVLINQELTEFIKNLKDNCKIGLISNSNSEFISKVFKEYNLKSLFDSLIISQEVGYIKPQREIFEIALRKLDVKAQEAFFIDDREVHVLAAEKLGIKGTVFKDTQQLKTDFAKFGIK